MNTIAEFIKQKRKEAGLTQEDFALRSGLGLRFVRELEQGKETVRMDKVNQALSMFGMKAVPGRKENPSPVSLTLPIQAEEYTSKTLFAFFDGLIPEGWLLDIVSSNWKIDRKDRFGLLLVACKDPIGNVQIKGAKE